MIPNQANTVVKNPAFCCVLCNADLSSSFDINTLSTFYLLVQRFVKFRVCPFRLEPSEVSRFHICLTLIFYSFVISRFMVIESYRYLIDVETSLSSRQAVIDVSVVRPFKGGVKVSHGIDKFPSNVATSKCCPGNFTRGIVLSCIKFQL